MLQEADNNKITKTAKNPAGDLVKQSDPFMEDLNIEPTKTTFGVRFHSTNGFMEIKGNSYPENAIEFFQPLLDWVRNFTKANRKPVRLVFKVNYFNTSSSKYIFKLMEIFHEYQKRGNKIEVQWQFFQGQEDMLETWQELMGELDMKYQVVK